MNKETENKFAWVLGILMTVFFFITIIYTILDCIKIKNVEKELGTETYELVIVDKYECLGSTFHLLGGRATESEYHLVYKYRCINRPDNVYISVWEQRDIEVNHITWLQYNVGDKLTTNTQYLLY